MFIPVLVINIKAKKLSTQFAKPTRIQNDQKTATAHGICRVFCKFFWIPFVPSSSSKLLQQGKTITIEKMEVDIDPAHVKVTANLHEMEGVNVVDLDIEVLKEEPEVHFQAVVYRHNVDHYEHVYKSALTSGCTPEAIKDPVLLFIFKESMKYGNLTEACPSKIGHYQLRNFKIESTDLPHELSPGSYRFEFSALVKKDGQLHDIYTDKYYFSAS